MRIGIDASRAAFSQRAGTENYSYHLLKSLLPLLDREPFRQLKAILYSPLPLPEDVMAGNRSAEAKVLAWPRLWTHTRLSWEMLCDRPDVLFVPAHVLPLLHPRRTVVTIHDLGYVRYSEAHPLPAWLYLVLSTQFNAKQATHLITPSEFTKWDVVERLGVHPDKVTAIYSGISSEFRVIKDQALVEAMKSRYGIDGRYLLYVGTVHPRKNLLRLLQAFALAKETVRFPEKLVIAGKMGWKTKEIERETAKLGDWVLWLGYVAEADLPLLYNGATAFILPSLYEGFGFPVLEAMACGTPVIASDVSSLPEICDEAALLVNPHDVEAVAAAMRRVLVSEPLREELRAKGLQRAEAFSWRRTAEQTLEVLLKVAED